MNQRINLIERLQLIVSRSSKSKDNTSALLEHGDVAGTYRRIYDVANSLASSEGLMWVQVKYSQDVIDNMRANEESRVIPNEGAPQLLETQLWEYVDAKRKEYLSNMTQLVELYIKSRWTDNRR